MAGPDDSLLYSEDPMERSVSRTARDIEFELEMETLARVKPVTPGDVDVSSTFHTSIFSTDIISLVDTAVNKCWQWGWTLI